MSEHPKVTDAEMEIMKVLWDDAPQTANSISEAVKERKQWDHRTVKTLINRLHKKGAIDFKKDGRQYLYFPLLQKDECLRQEAQSFASKFRDGMLGSLLTTFIKEEQLSTDEIEELKQILEEKSRG